MDGLSVAASVIAVMQASAAVGKGIKLLTSLRHVQAEFRGLVNELSTLKAVIDQIKGHLQALDEEQTSDTRLPSINTSVAEQLRKDLEDVAGELEALCGRLTATDKNKDKEKHSETNETEELRVSKLTWMREKSNMAKLRAKAKSTRDDLQLCFSALLSSQSIRQSRVVFDVRQLVQASSHNISHDIGTSHDMLRTNQAGIEEIKSILEQHVQSENRNRASNQHQPLQNGVHTFGRNRDTLLIRGSVHQACSRYCKCQCHVPSTLHTPSWMNSVLGSLLLQYDSVPLLKPRKCNLIDCKNQSSGTFHLAYYFPIWMVSRAVFFATSWNSVTGMGSSLHLRVPRVIPYEQMLSAVRSSDMDWIKGGMAKRTLLPTDVDETGDSLLLLSLREYNLELADFLLNQGWPVDDETQSGSSIADVCHHLYFAMIHNPQRYYSPEAIEFVKDLAFSKREQGGTSTIIHDSVLGVTSTSLVDAITQAPSDINTLDSRGWGPLHWAMWLEEENAFDTLLRHGADVRLRTRGGMTPLHCAARYLRPGSTHMASALLHAKADVNAQEEYRGRRGRTPIIYALSNPEMIQLLLDHDATPVVMTDSMGWASPLLHCAWERHDFGRHDPTKQNWERSLDLLISAGMDLDLPSQQSIGAGRTALHQAIMWRNAALVEVLIEREARVDAVDKEGSNILHFAAQNTSQDVIDVLRDAKIKGLNPDGPNAAGDTPMKIMAARMFGTEDLRQPGVTVPTYIELLTFKELLYEIRERNRSEYVNGHPSNFRAGGRVREIGDSGIESEEDDDVLSFNSDIVHFDESVVQSFQSWSGSESVEADFFDAVEAHAQIDYDDEGSAPQPYIALEI